MMVKNVYAWCEAKAYTNSGAVQDRVGWISRQSPEEDAAEDAARSPAITSTACYKIHSRIELVPFIDLIEAKISTCLAC